ncbi:MAG: hypothetical protein CSA07_03820 [Bacteroidia bacterium]|nr:MAG: hypothetical protein CSA07_03820 [Bacteroidia bacterium]
MKSNGKVRKQQIVLLALMAALSAGIGELRAQELPQTAPRQFRDSASGKLYWNKHQPLYLFVATSPDAANAHLLKSEGQAQWGTPFYLDTEGINFVRTRWAVNPKTGQAIQPKQEILWEVYADGRPPRTTIQTHADSKVKNLLGKNASVTLKATDAVSGVQTIYYAINGQPYRAYEGPISVAAEGKVQISYLATDRVGNREEARTLSLTVDRTPPSTTARSIGINVGSDNTLAKSTTLVLEAHDEVAGIASTHYRIDSGRWMPYTRKARISLRTIKDGQHHLEFYSKDRVGNSEPVQRYDFYLDDTPPITISDVLGDKFVVGKKMFFSGRTKLKITSVDNHAGVSDLLYSIDGQPFVSYTEPFYMPQQPGWHVVRYYALDSTENRTVGVHKSQYLEYRMNIDRIYVDLTGPTISHSLVGKSYKRNDTVFVAPTTQITLKGHDPESGLRDLAYSIDHDAWERKYNGPFNLEGISSGEHHVEYFGYDNVNNRNIGSFSFILDSDAPEVDYHVSVKPYENEVDADGQPVYPRDARVFLSSQDNMTGVAKLEYSLNGRPYKPYQGAFGGLERGVNRLKIRATDHVGNAQEKLRKITVR